MATLSPDVLSLKKGWKSLLHAIHHDGVLPALPRIEIRYEDLSYHVQRPVKDHTVKTVATTLKGVATPFERPPTYQFDILSDVSGVIKPGTMSLLLCPPGHGKSALMKVLANRVKPTAVTGNVTYNGHVASETPLNLRKAVAYVAQNDVHLPLLTVRETLTFAAHNAWADAAAVSPAARSLQDEWVNIVIKLLGLEECADTVVGNEFVRGISGGQRKRVTIGEALVCFPRVLLLDEITTGLDSGTSEDIARALKAWCEVTGGSVVAALLQPTPEVYDLFDDTVLLREGRVLYHGPRAECIPYFASLGIQCPDDIDYADFLEDFLVNPVAIFEKQQLRATPGAAALRDGPIEVGIAGAELDLDAASTESKSGPPGSGSPKAWSKGSPRSSAGSEESKASRGAAPVAIKYQLKQEDLTSKRLAELFNSKAHFKAASASPLPKVNLSHDWVRAQYAGGDGNGWWFHTKSCLARQATVLKRDPEILGPRLGQAVFQSLMVGSLFWQLDDDAINLRIGVLLFAVISLSFSNMVELPAAILGRDVLHKQTDMDMYPVSSYVVSVVLLHFPMAAVEVTLFGSIMYWMTGLSPYAPEFFVFMGMLYVTSITVAMIFRTIAWASPSPEVAQVASPMFVATSLIYGGFLITREKIQPFLIWVYYLSPFSWAVRSLAINEFHSQDFDDDVTLPDGSTKMRGDLMLEALEVQTEPEWEWAGVVYLLTFFVVAVAGATFLLRSIRRDLTIGTSRPAEETEVTPAMVREARLEASNTYEVKSAGVMPFTPIHLSWRDLVYSVPIKKKDADGKRVTEHRKLLKGVTGYAKPGRMTALMGASGAGKTTLMDVIAGRKTKGTISGDILVNGHPKQPVPFARVTGYVEQEDLHDGTATVREALLFSARCRLPESVSDATRAAFVDEIMDILELTPLADRIIGDSVIPGLAAGELKRVTIAVELCANSSVLFCDEPTSGLDSKAALTVMRVLRNVASTGRSVVCTIHQPSAEVFHMFDQLLLLASGGHQVYFGPLGDKGAALVDYLQAIPGVKPMRARANPATYMLEATGDSSDIHGAGGAGAAAAASPEEFKQLLVATYKASDVAKAECADKHFAPVEGVDKLAFDSTFAVGAATQFKAVFMRFVTGYWRQVEYNVGRLVMLLFLGFLFGFVYFQVEDDDQAGVQSKLSSALMAGAFPAVMHLQVGAPVIMRARATYYRETASNYYSSFVYSTSLALIEIPYVVTCSVLFSVPFYLLAGYSGGLGGFLFAHILISIAMSYLGQAMSTVLASDQLVQIAVGFLVSVFFLLGGVFIPGPEIPEGWKWAYDIDPFPRAIRALVMREFHCDNEDQSTCPTIDIVSTSGTATVSKSEYMSDYTGWDHGGETNSALILLIHIAVFHIVTALALRFLKHQSR